MREKDRERGGREGKVERIIANRKGNHDYQKHVQRVDRMWTGLRFTK